MKTEAIELGDYRREDKAFTKFLPIQLTDTSKTDIGAIAKAVAAAATPSKDRVPPALYLVIGYEAGARATSSFARPWRMSRASTSGIPFSVTSISG